MRDALSDPTSDATGHPTDDLTNDASDDATSREATKFDRGIRSS